MRDLCRFRQQGFQVKGLQPFLGAGLFDNDVKVTVNTIAIDHYDSNNVYIGLSEEKRLKVRTKVIAGMC